MRWKIEIPPAKGMITVGIKGPDIGDIKQKVRFAWFPTKAGKAHKVWLESYVEVWEFRNYQIIRNDPLGSRWHLVDSIHNTTFITTTGWRLKETKLS